MRGPEASANSTTQDAKCGTQRKPRSPKGLRGFLHFRPCHFSNFQPTGESPVIQVMCERCYSKPMVAKRVAFDGATGSLCSDCVHAFSLWLHGASSFRSGPPEAGVTS